MKKLILSTLLIVVCAASKGAYLVDNNNLVDNKIENTESLKIDSLYDWERDSSMIAVEVIEVFGSRYRAPKKIDFITRLPLRVSEQIQSISVVSEAMIEKQGTLTLSDATRNVVGVSTFATYGGASESLSARGFRGLPVLKNGVRVHSDFRGQGALMDMQGIESIQVVKGSAAITQGIGNDLGAAGGTVNVATKTPRYVNEATVGLRLGSWGLVRPTFDVQGSFADNRFAVRLNGALERADNYRIYVNKDRVYLNPSLEWRISNNTTLTAELDYLHDSRTPDRGTVNLAADSINALYNMPDDRFLGFKSDRIFTNQMSYSVRLSHRFGDKLSLRAVYAGSSLSTDNTGASTSKLSRTGDFNMLIRSIGRSQRSDNNQVFQLDLVGQDVYTGPIRHTFQVGADFRATKVSSTSFTSKVVDTINVLQPFSNTLPGDVALTALDPTISTAYSYGILAQDVITFHKTIKAVLGLRYSFGNSYDNSSAGQTTGDALNPMLGLIITPIEGLNIFGSYTNTTDIRSAANLKVDGTPIGASTTQQFEVGIKSELLNNRLRANLTLFSVMNYNLAYQVYDEANQATGRYEQAGDLSRRGIEVEISGRVHRNIELILGYAYLDAKYVDSPAYVNGSTPMNAPKHTANGWIYYTAPFGMTIGVGAYYVGERPVNDYTKKTTHANSDPGVKPFDLPAYTTLNATLGYSYKRASVNVIFNNITNTLGYNSYYRGGFINKIDPFNASVSLAYRF